MLNFCMELPGGTQWNSCESELSLTFLFSLLYLFLTCFMLHLYDTPDCYQDAWNYLPGEVKFVLSFIFLEKITHLVLYMAGLTFVLYWTLSFSDSWTWYKYWSWTTNLICWQIRGTDHLHSQSARRREYCVHFVYIMCTLCVHIYCYYIYLFINITCCD